MCKHMCQASGKNFMVRRGDRFIDGTRCEPDSLEDGGKPGWCLTGRCKVGPRILATWGSYSDGPMSRRKQGISLGSRR